VEQLENALRLLEISEVMDAERLQRRPLRKVISHGVVSSPGDQDLAPVADLE
jgi:hypothetical protein